MENFSSDEDLNEKRVECENDARRTADINWETTAPGSDFFVYIFSRHKQKSDRPMGAVGGRAAGARV